MYELLKNILDAIANLAPTAAASRRDAKQRKLGAHLFTIYLAAYEIVWRGDRIVELLQRASAGFSDGIRSKEFHDLLNAQAAAISKLDSDIFEYGDCLAVLDPESFGDFRRLMEGKFRRVTALTELSKTLGRGALPRVSERPEVDPRVPGTRSPGHGARQLINLLTPGPTWEELPQLDSLEDGPALYALIDRYLREVNPRAELQHTKEALGRIREELDQHFTVSDILLELSRQRQTGRPPRTIWSR